MLFTTHLLHSQTPCETECVQGRFRVQGPCPRTVYPYLSLAIVVALVQRVTQIKYSLDDNQKREAKRHKVAYDENIL